MSEELLKENNMIKFFMNYKKMQGKVFDNLFPFKHYLKILPKKKKYKKLNVKDFGNALFDAYEDSLNFFNNLEDVKIAYNFIFAENFFFMGNIYR